MKKESKAERLAYVKSSDVNIIRRKHRIGIRVGHTVEELIQILEMLPKKAIVDEVVDSDFYGDDVSTIEFHEEYVKHE